MYCGYFQMLWGYIAFQNKYCRHHTNWRLIDSWLWKDIRKSESMWQQFLTEIVQWIVPTAYFSLDFFSLLTALSTANSLPVPRHNLSWQTSGEKLKSRKHTYMTFLIVQPLPSSEWIIFPTMFPLMFSENVCDCMRLILPNMSFRGGYKIEKTLKMSPLEHVPTVQKEALA